MTRKQKQIRVSRKVKTEEVKSEIVVVVNGSEKVIPFGLTLAGLIESFRLKEQSVVVERNLKVVEKKVYASIELKENDRIEIVGAVGGG